MKSIYLGNLPLETTEDEVRTLFSAYGEVAKVTLLVDHETGRSRGFGFVVMEPEAADRAIEAMDGSELEGRTLRVNEARDRGFKPPRRSW